MNPKISVIIPAFNAYNDLKNAINSIINQSIGFDNIELILVDDKSTDMTKSIIQEYENKYDNIKGIYLNKNSGLPGKPRNIGIQNATGEYIVFLDADDQYLKDGLNILYQAIIKEDSDFVIASHYININDDKIKANFPFPENITLNPKQYFEKLSYNQFVAPWSKIFKKEFILNNNINFPEDTLCEDTYFYFKSLLNSSKLTILPQDVIYMYNTYENKKTAIHDHDMEKFNNFLNGMYKVNTLLDEEKNIFLSENIGSLLLIFSNLNKKDKKEAILKIYEFEKKLDKLPIIERKEIAILNNLILKKRFKLAILLSNIYSSLYNNKIIKKTYRIFNNKKMVTTK